MRRDLAILPLLPVVLSACSGAQSALDPAGEEADAVYRLFIVMVVGAALIWLLVMALMLYAGRRRAEPWSADQAGRLIAWGGVAFPVVVLFALLAYGLWLMPVVRPWLARAEPAPEVIEVTGEQFWWRIRYPAAGGNPGFETANELRLPLGQRTAFALKAADVIHSFWIPALGGKMDMIPGRTNILSLVPTKAGIYRAPCAEFCGPSHALMAFTVVVMPPDDYARWKQTQAKGHAPSPDAGARLFDSYGCGGCHGLRGVTPPATLGPDLTLFGQRQTVAAGTAQNTVDNVARFIRDPEAMKPGAKMPAFSMLSDAEITAMATYLKGLK